MGLVFDVLIFKTTPEGFGSKWHMVDLSRNF